MRLHKRIIGQSQAVTAVCNAIRRSRAAYQILIVPLVHFYF